MKRSIYILITLALSLLTLALSGCRERDTLSDADAVYIIIQPEGPLQLAVTQDTIPLSASVRNVSGREISDAVVSWSVEDKTVVRLLEGNRLVAVRGGEGRTTKVRATLQNGQSTYIRVSASRSNSGSLLLLLDEQRRAEDIVYVAPAANTNILLVTNPEQLLTEYTPTVSDYDASLLEIEPRALDPEIDKDIIERIPKGGRWFTIKPKLDKVGRTSATFSVGSIRKTFEVVVGTRVNDDSNSQYGMALNKDRTEAELSRTVNVGYRGAVEVFVTATPSTVEGLEAIKNDFKWELAGTGGIILDTSSELRNGLFVFTAQVQAGSMPSQFSISAELQGHRVRQSFKVEDFSQRPFENLVYEFEGDTFELQTGEIRPLIIRVTPRESQYAVLYDIQERLRFSRPGVAELQVENGAYQLRGLVAGETNMIITIRGREFTLPIRVVPEPRSVTIDGRTPVAVMSGDEVEWSAEVIMAGSDTPQYANLHWSLATPGIAEIVGATSGRSIKLRGLTVEGGNRTVEVTADYRGKQGKRTLRVMSPRPSVELSATMLDMEQSGYSPSSPTGEAVFPLVAKGSDQVLPSEIRIQRTAGGNFSPQAGDVYTIGAGYRIYAKWGDLVREITSGVIRIAAGSSSDRGNVTFDLNIVLANGHRITITGTVMDLYIQ